MYKLLILILPILLLTGCAKPHDITTLDKYNVQVKFDDSFDKKVQQSNDIFCYDTDNFMSTLIFVDNYDSSIVNVQDILEDHSTDINGIEGYGYADSELDNWDGISTSYNFYMPIYNDDESTLYAYFYGDKDLVEKFVKNTKIKFKSINKEVTN